MLATSDLHMHLSGYDYHADAPCVQKGLCLTATLVRRAREEVAGTILLDNGDFLHGSPLGDYVAARQDGGPHPMMQAMAHLGYDAVNLGNHEFSMGIPLLAAALAEARFPVLSANTCPRDGSALGPLIAPWALIERDLPDQHGQAQRVRLGVIGVLPPDTALWDRQAIGGEVQMQPMAQTVAQQVPRLRAAGADVVVVLAHCGIGSAQAGSGPDAAGTQDAGLQDAGQQIAAIDGVDAVILGHRHMVFPAASLAPSPEVDPVGGTLHGKPAVMPGFFGSHLGVIDIDLIRAAGAWRVRSHKAEARAIASRDGEGRPLGLVAPDDGLTRLIQPAHEAVRLWARRPVGRTPQAIHSYFAMITDCPSVQIVNQAQAQYVAARLDGGPLAHLPVLSATAPFKAGGFGGPENYTLIPAGDILLRHAADLYIHPNTIMALLVTGAELRRWLEYSARGYRQIVPGGADQPLLGPDLPCFVYDTISGLTYEVDLSQPPHGQGGQRIRNLCWQGQPLDPAQQFVLATNSFRGSGNGGFSPAEPARVVLEEQTANRDILIAHIGRALNGAAAPERGAPAWRFSPLPGTSVTFDTSPLAAACLADAPHLALTPLARTEEGFLRLRLDL
ncbi:bifunctional 2',3'-cyclic-nucleotide 2'-phosphodiesterase/3'-nucleotidase [Rhodobacter sp. ETT8]|uniref:Bifunctional 2',3'-cyclic-nucleotide 2'-phosphodiesterase/3'-nucleotidase n=1 Tax=Pseudotabrizicola algicola TaxID=2709381 RepID=A0A6B3RKS5_9RHOB|nr:bifunctional 2',3'-cyclic-nucleotide 2'-phosphodiesterase/3'-nucleotidase [Pseudotabrizicola algicola]